MPAKIFHDADQATDPKPGTVQTNEPKQNPELSPDDPRSDRERPVPKPLAPELLPIGDPAGAA